MAHPSRQCRTCRHFQAAPLLDKGWCRNPVLYDVHHQHLVTAHELDCARAFGDLWQPQPGAEPAPLGPGEEHPDPSKLSPIHELVPGLARLRLRAGRLAFTSLLGALLLVVVGLRAGSAPDETMPPPLPTAGPTALAMTESIAATAAPALPPSPTIALPAAETPRPSPPPATATPISAPPTPQPSPPAVAIVTATPAPATAAPAPASPSPVATSAAPSPARLDAGARAVVTTSPGGLRLRLRQAPSLSGAIIDRIGHGQTLRIIAGPRQAEGETWWQAEYAGKTGWVAGAFLQPAPAP